MSFGLYNAPLAITLCLCFWAGFYCLVRYTFPNKNREWCNRILTMFHGCVIAVTGMNECFAQADALFQNTHNPSTGKHLVIIVISLGYFLFDLFWCMCYHTETVIMLTHHVFSCIALSRMYWRGTNGVQTVCGLGGMEVSNPLLQIRWFLRSAGYYNTKWFTGIEMTFVVLFFVMRIGFGTCFAYQVMFSYPYDWEFRLFTFIIYAISIAFIRDIVQYIRRKYLSDKVSVRIEDVAEDTV